MTTEPITHPIRRRHWEDGHGWVSDAPRTSCATCGAEIPKRVGMGPPFKYCELHRPAESTRHARWYATHKEDRREYARAHFGYRPRIESLCVDCARPFTHIRPELVRCAYCRPIFESHARLLARLGLS